jgi:exodeoxyribonuclease VII large subunit
MNEQTLSVSEFLDLTNELLGQQEFIVQGEVTGAKPHPTGFYFSLRDPEANALMDCYLNPYTYRNSGIRLEDGMVVKVGGLASVYKPKGRFSFRIETVEAAGEGSLKKAYETLKRQLAAEGLFERKRPLPEFLSHIGLITSRTGAVIQDFRNNLLPLGLHVLQCDSRVEGASAPGQLLDALAWFNGHADRVGSLVIVRGGGSLEDLQAFNDERVVRGIFASRVPTVVAIGHAPDVPLAQMVADAVADTPTAAAYLINDTWSPLTTDVPALASRLSYAFRAALDSCTARVDSLSRHLEASDPERLLRLGYSIVTDRRGTVIRSACQVSVGESVQARIAEGRFTALVEKVSPH